jgi:hypothetical protein
MLRARWFVVALLLVTGVVGGLLDARGPFDAHPALAYDQFLSDVEAGNVAQIVRWRDRLEVTDQGVLRSVDVPADRDLQADLGQARVAGGVGLAYAGLPDAWLGAMTPWIPLLLLLAGTSIWVSAIVRGRHAAQRSADAGSPQSAT